ncbi:MAG: dTDP-4-dehydrorhamnose 3,5-epimerase [Vulcanimicrobiota bacterium]
MLIEPLPLNGAHLVTLEPRGDERGFFARFFCQREFSEAGLSSSFVQVNNSWSREKGTLRGLHYQLGPSQETKLVRCISGRVWDVIVDLRPGSETFRSWHAEELSAANRAMMYVPKGFAHGFITLEEGCELIYLVDEFYAPEQERGLRWDDPWHGIEWPLSPTVLSARDQSHPDFSRQWHLGE